MGMQLDDPVGMLPLIIELMYRMKCHCTEERDQWTKVCPPVIKYPWHRRNFPGVFSKECPCNQDEMILVYLCCFTLLVHSKEMIF